MGHSVLKLEKFKRISVDSVEILGVQKLVFVKGMVKGNGSWVPTGEISSDLCIKRKFA